VIDSNHDRLLARTHTHTHAHTQTHTHTHTHTHTNAHTHTQMITRTHTHSHTYTAPRGLQTQVWHTQRAIHVVRKVHVEAVCAPCHDIYDAHVSQQPLQHAVYLLP